ncbi:HAD superfamily hydrolase [Lepidopterella palustris CBS 459.81]|uniref:HAD superfamily hydrolase n=1 Tax=Lepidopterella palustris CBS 459.81 TaxID=1314670 RepID=A0A8E2EKC9_9PEZI|nr:HAD superfamily hydrolase [Lepidopterella palustris CBS 459.81]
MTKITTILLDCDNTLVLSEELAFEACAELSNEILEKQGISDRYTGPSLLKSFVGQNFRGMMTSLCKKYNFTLTPEEFDSYVDRELGKVIETLEKKAQPCPGVMDELEKLHGLQKMHAEKKYLMAVVSSSALSRVQASIKKVGMDKYFDPGHVFSAATSLDRPTSKPDPAIYLHACKVLGKSTSECVAVEDSRSGATAAKNAKIPLIGYVGPYEGAEQDEMYNMLKNDCGAIYVMRHWNEFETALKTVEDAVA